MRQESEIKKDEELGERSVDLYPGGVKHDGEEGVNEEEKEVLLHGEERERIESEEVVRRRR